MNALDPTDPATPGPEPADTKPSEAGRARRHWLGVLARAGRDELEDARQRQDAVPAHTLLRPPETGLVMARGRAGGNGRAFNLGEVAVTRCSLRLADGTIGHGYVRGRDGRRAELVALFDALLQDPGRRAALLDTLIGPLAEAQDAARHAEARKAAATKVEFFTVLRGHD